MAKHIFVKGRVHEVGFHPFVSGLAARLNLHGWIHNRSDGVEIVIQGPTADIENFLSSLQAESSVPSRDNDFIICEEPDDIEWPGFEIQPAPGSLVTEPIPTDLAICPDCERELFNPHNRRYLHPFINCAHCGPRFTIFTDLPFDRSASTMAEFNMCAHCEAEYRDPLDRRFHAHAINCPECGPFVALREVHSQFPDSKISSIECRTSAILKARRLLREGYILGIKSLGGFQLACDASNTLTVEELRDRTGRLEAPFALMASSVDVVRSLCHLSPYEETILTSRERPIVLLEKRNQQAGAYKLSRWVAPHLDMLGVQLPHTPLLHLLLNQTDPLLAVEPVPPLLAMTSGSFLEKPTATDDEDALHRLAPLVDAFIVHNGVIHVRCDDSVVRVNPERVPVEHGGETNVNSPLVFMRRSRGYAPYALHLPGEVQPTLAIGGEWKNTFCLARGQQAYLSHHIGHMENAETYESFEQSVQHLLHLFDVQPHLVAHDLNPSPFSMQYAQSTGLPPLGVQHHHAHLVSCMVENGLDDRPVIGVALDGGGAGSDGKLWGAEVLLTSFAQAQRFAQLEYLPVPCSDTGLHVPWHTALGYAYSQGMDIEGLPGLQHIDAQALHDLRRELEEGTTQQSSAMGDLFDMVACLTGVRSEVSYECQAALELETLAKPFVAVAAPYPYAIDENGILHVQDLMNAIVKDVRSDRSVEIIVARFHKTIAEAIHELCMRARSSTGLNEVVLSGDLWQNLTLLNLARIRLKQAGFDVYFHQQVPTNDGGLALGQAVIANYSTHVQERKPADSSPS